MAPVILVQGLSPSANSSAGRLPWFQQKHLGTIFHWIGLRENLQETHGFLPSNIGLSCKFSHNPILWISVVNVEVPSNVLSESFWGLLESVSSSKAWPVHFRRHQGAVAASRTGHGKQEVLITIVAMFCYLLVWTGANELL